MKNLTRVAIPRQNGTESVKLLLNDCWGTDAVDPKSQRTDQVDFVHRRAIRVPRGVQTRKSGFAVERSDHTCGNSRNPHVKKQQLAIHLAFHGKLERWVQTVQTFEEDDTAVFVLKMREHIVDIPIVHFRPFILWNFLFIVSNEDVRECWTERRAHGYTMNLEIHGAVK